MGYAGGASGSMVLRSEAADQPMAGEAALRTNGSQPIYGEAALRSNNRMISGLPNS